MRGKARPEKIRSVSVRITPAYAGKRKFYHLHNSIFKDHPRLCGEKFYSRQTNSAVWGSPPPMRGKAYAEMQRRLEPRITPAYAGKSITERTIIIIFWDHPRLCGEKIGLSIFGGITPGSPPPMRGKVLCHLFEIFCTRITPAYAGKSEAKPTQELTF